MMTSGYEQTSEPDLQEQLDDLVRGHIAGVHTGLPGRIESYDGKTADVKPLIMRRYSVDGDDGGYVDKLVEYPVIPRVPIAWPRGGGFAFRWPLTKGDLCWLMFSEQSLDAYLDSDGRTVINPDDARGHDITDAVCYPGMSTKVNPIPDGDSPDLIIGAEDGTVEIRVTPGGEVQMVASKVRHGTVTANKALALAQQVDARLSALETQVTLPHLGNLGVPTVPPPFVPGGGGTTTASTRVFTDA